MGKRLRGILSGMLTVCMLFTMLPVGVLAATDTTVSLSQADVLKHGRTYQGNDGTLYLDWGYSGISFNFTGTGAKATMTSSNTSDTMCGFVNVYVDGALVPTSVLKLNQSSAVYTLAEGLTDGEHTVTLRKRNEAVYGGSATIGLVDLTVMSGSLSAAPTMSDRRIEVIGDSITAGHGNLANGSNVSYNNTVSDATASYAGLTAQALGAEMDILARSGIGFVRNATCDTMFDVYEEVSGLGDKCTDAYNFDSNEKDVIIINLGTNDNGAKMDDTGETVTDEYVQSEAKAFLELIRQNNQSAEIIWAYGIMGSGRAEAIQAAIAELNDDKITFFALDRIDGEKEGYGSGNHPTVVTAINRSMDLAEYIAEKTGWNYDYDAQLAWQLRVAENYTTEYLQPYTAASVASLNTAVEAAKTLSSSATNDRIKEAVDGIQTAHQNLIINMDEIAVVGAEEKTATGHYMEVKYAFDAVDISAYKGRQLYITYDAKLDLTLTPTNDAWRGYVRNGRAYITDENSTETEFKNGQSFGGSSLANVASDWATVTIPLDEAYLTGDEITAFRQYYYNDTGHMTASEMDGVAWDNNSGVTLRIKNVRLMVASPVVHPEVVVYSVNAADYGADATGENDATTAIQNAINAVKDKGGIVYLPVGRYRVEGTLTIYSGVTLRGDWKHPDDGGLGQGTILMAYAEPSAADTYDPTTDPFITIQSGSCLKNISVWYPEQNAESPVAYPATILAHGHSDVIDVTLYNSYYGYYNNDCSSMLIRGLYGTALYKGVHAAYAYDIPRIENTYFDTAYWANSGLDNAPIGDALTALNAYTEANLIAIQAGEQDWGYWYDLYVNHAKYGIYLTAVPDNGNTKMIPGNIAAGEVNMQNVQYGVYAENAGYPGFQLTYGEIEASEYGFYIPVKPDYQDYIDQGINVAYYENVSYAISKVTFKGGKGGVYGLKTGNYGVSLNDCVFEDWSEYAIRMDSGSLVCSNSRFATNSLPVKLNDDLAEAIFLGNTFTYTEEDWSEDSRVTRDDANTSVPNTPDFTYTYDFNAAPTSQTVFNVMNYGAVSGTTSSVPDTDSTAAFQKALDTAEAAGGGTVYVPGGVYRIDGSLSIATGVELRGTFESAHYGNSTTLGSQLYVYGGKGEENGTPLITLAENSGVKGFSIFYPEQGYTDQDPEHLVYAYPPTIQANADTWIQNMSIVCAYTAIDAMTDRCDNIVITDVTGAAMYATLIMGHGTNGGHVQNLHFNYSGWTHQGEYDNKPNSDEASALFNDYTTSKVDGLILGDCQNVQFLSCFNILVADQIVLEQDPYTGGSFDGTMWGVAFDAAGNGIVGKAGCDARLDIVASMGVFNQQGGGYNVVTQSGFTGKVGLYNADAWGGNSQLAYVEGGKVELVQYFSWCAYNGYCGEGGTLNLYGSTLVDNNSNDKGYIPHLVYAEGAAGEVIGNLSCREQLNVNVWPGADVTMESNGATATVPAATGLVFSNAVGTYTADNTSSTDEVLDTGWVIYDNGSATSGVNIKDRENSLVLQLTLTLTKTDSASADTVVFGSGQISLRSVDSDEQEVYAYWSVAELGLTSGQNTLRLCLTDMTDLSLNWEKVNRLRVYLDGMNGVAGTYSLSISEAQVMDTTAVNQQKYILKQLLDEEFNSDQYTDEQKAQYTALYNRAQALYADDTATADGVLAITQELKEMQSVLVSPADKEALRLAVRTETQCPLTLELYTASTASAYSAALDAAHTLLADDAASQTEIDNALSALQEAKAALQVVDRYTVFTLSTNWDVTNGTVGDNAEQFYHNWRDTDSQVDLTLYDPDALVLRMNLRIGLTDNATVSTTPSTLTIKDVRLAIRSNKAQPEETSLYDTSILNGLHWGDNLVEIPFSALKSKDSGNTDWARIDNLFLSYSITELQSAVVGDYIAEIDNVCLVNKAVETTLGNVSVVGNGRIDVTGDLVYGGDDVLTADTSDEDSTFVGWHANTAFVYPAEDGSNALPLVATENESVTAYFLKENEKAVVFYGKYNRVIDVQVVTSAFELKVPTAPDLEGYTFNGWNEPQENWEWQLEQYDDVMPLYAVYTNNPAATRYDLTIVGAHRTNGSATTDLLFDTCIKVQADTPTGMVLSHWELDGMNVGGGNAYTFYVSGNNVIKAVYVNEGEAVSTPVLSAAVKQTIIESTGSGRYTISYICQTYLPSDYTLLEYGTVIAPKVSTLQAIQQGTDVDQGLKEGSDYLWVVSTSRTPNRQYMVELRNVKEGKNRYAMAYIIARDAQDEIHVVYSSIRLASTDTSTDGIGSGDSAVDPFG